MFNSTDFLTLVIRRSEITFNLVLLKTQKINPLKFFFFLSLLSLSLVSDRRCASKKVSDRRCTWYHKKTIVHVLKNPKTKAQRIIYE